MVILRMYAAQCHPENTIRIGAVVLMEGSEGDE